MSSIDSSHRLIESPKPMERGNSRSTWNANSDSGRSSESPTHVASGYRNSTDLLRRLSLTDNERLPEVDPVSTYPGLGLSGRIISATVCIPYSLRFLAGEWDIRPRRGTSALFNSFSYLSKPDSPWDHTLVGWTGEIIPIPGVLDPCGSHGSTSTSKQSSLDSVTRSLLNKASAPVPLDTSIKKESVQLPPNAVELSKADRQELASQLIRDPGGKIVPVWLHDESEDKKDKVIFTDQARWRRYAEHELYTLFHYKQHEPTDGRSEKKSWADYCRMNQRFADSIVEIYKPGDIVWIHDHHLLLLPNLLRQRIPNIYIGFFLHIPFPSSEFMRCLSRRKEILTGALGSNMIGFQNYSYSRHFSSCCTRILGFDSLPAGVDAYGAHIAIDVFPIGIDAEAVAKSAYGDHSIDAKVQRIRQQYPGQKIIVGRDRLDTVRGVAQKLQAYDMFLERYPQWRGKVVLIQVTSPTSIEEEKEDSSNKISNKISDLVSKINGLYGGLEYTPVFHFSQYLSRDEYFALLRIADVGLITSVRDGMNTTSLEYVLCQREHHGPLILSEFSGTAGSLHQAIHINPWNLGGVAEAINKALTMSSQEKEDQHRLLYKHVTTHTVQTWSKTYIKRLIVNLASFNQSIATPVLDKAKLLSRYRRARKRLFLFDYDGTLTPIVNDPEAAIPSDRIIRTIKTLAQDKRNSVWIVSGRDQAFLDEWMGHISELGLSAEHGSFVRQPESDEWENLTEKMDMSWQKEVVAIFKHYTERTQGSFIEHKRIALTWHYRRSDPEYGAFQARECKKQLERTVVKDYDVEVMNGKANLEVRPSFVNKGEIAKRLVREYGEATPPDFIFCSGDDFTDEDMFRALRDSGLPNDNVFSVTVGASSKKTLADWHLLEPADVIATVALLNGSVNIGDVEGLSAASQRLKY